jgi:hypothetical protein
VSVVAIVPVLSWPGLAIATGLGPVVGPAIHVFSSFHAPK